MNILYINYNLKEMFSSRDFHNSINSEKSACRLFRDKGILKSTWVCPEQCGNNFVRLKWRQKQGGYAFKCSKCKNRRSLFAGSWMEHARMKCLQVVDLLFSWAAKSCCALAGAEGRMKSSKTITDWIRFIRDVCVESVSADGDEQLGGAGVIVEIDETLVAKRKYNRGRVVEQVWLFGAVERVTGKCFFEVVANRSEAVLLEVIRRKIRKGTTIMSDSHRSYTNLEQHGYVHFKVNHSLNFVDPNTQAHTQTIEATWGALKMFLRSVGRNLGPHLEEYIAEFVYRRKHAGRLFDQILADIARFHPPR